MPIPQSIDVASCVEKAPSISAIARLLEVMGFEIAGQSENAVSRKRNWEQLSFASGVAGKGRISTKGIRHAG